MHDDQQIQSGQGSLQRGSGQAGSAQTVQPTTALEAICSRIKEQNGNLHESICRLRDDTIRITGNNPNPPREEASAEKPTPSGLVFEIQAALDHADALHSELAQIRNCLGAI